MKRYLATLALLFVVAGLAFAVNSTSGEFSAVADSTMVNWTNVSGMGTYAVNVSMTNNNATRNITVLTQNYTSSVLNSTFGAAPFIVLPDNSTFLLNGSSENVTVQFQTSGLAPGRYSGPVVFLNDTNSSENASLNFTVDVPITFANNIGSFSGNISNSTEVYYFNASDVAYAAGFNITITDNTDNFTITVYDNASAQIASKKTADGTMFTWNVTASGYGYPLGGMWRIEAANVTASTTFNGTIELLQASLRANSTFVSGTAPYTENKGYNRTFTYTFTIENNAGYDVNISQVLNSSDYLNNSQNYMEWFHNLTEGTNLSAGLSGPVELSVTMDTSKTGDATGTYLGWLFINTSTGYPYNTYNLSVEVTLSGSLSVSVTDVTNDTEDSNTTLAGSWINITVVPKFQNGTIATGLVGDNFTATIAHQSIGSCSVSLENETKISDPGSNYLIQAYVSTSGCGQNSAMVGGNYTVSVSTTDITGSNTGSGTWNGTLIVNDSALNLSALVGTSEITGTTKNLNEIFDIKPKVYNYGSKTGTAVTVNQSVSGTCEITDTGNYPADPIYMGDISAWDTTGTLNATNYWRYQMTSAGTCNITLTASASSGAWADSAISIIVINSTSGGGSQSGGDQTTGQITAPSNASTTLAIDLSITSWPKHTVIVQGESKSVDVKVKNSGTKAVQDVETKVEGLDSGWWKGTLLTNLLAGQEYTLPVTFTIPENATVKNYSITFVATSPNATARASADLAVLPSESEKQAINESLVNLTKRYDELLKQMEEAASKGFDIAGVNSTLIDAKDILDKAQGYADAGDWFNVNALLGQLESALNNAETKMGALEKTGGLGIDLGGIEAPTYLMVGGALIVIVIGGVALWLTKRAEKGKAYAGFKSRPQLGVGKKMSKLKEKLKKAKPKKKKSKGSYHYQADVW